MAKFRDSTGRVVMRSTKKTVHREALNLDSVVECLNFHGKC
ncbi:MAG: hypothetical protein WCG63_05135 [Opitutaceae bacterium]